MHTSPLVTLKVPKREIFVTELFILSDPIWVGDLRTVSLLHSSFYRKRLPQQNGDR